MIAQLNSYQPAYWPVSIRLGWGREATAFQIFPGWERCAQIAHPLHFLFHGHAFSRQFRQVMVARVEPSEAALAREPQCRAVPVRLITGEAFAFLTRFGNAGLA